jgi:hypothetical protein
MLSAKRKICTVIINYAFKSDRSTQLVQEEAWLPYHKLASHKVRTLPESRRDRANLHLTIHYLLKLR